MGDQNLLPRAPQGEMTLERQPVVKTIFESLSQNDEKHVVPTPLSGIRIGKKRSN
jgi:hypothetical protein